MSGKMDSLKRRNASRGFGGLIILRTTLVKTLLATGLLIASAYSSAAEPADSSAGSPRGDKGIDIEPVLNTQSGQFRALLVGVNDYERLKDLKCCEADVTALRDRLVAMGFRPDTIKCLTTADPDPAYRPNYRNITERLDAMFSGLKEDAVLVIALSGHGGSFEWKDASGKVEKASFYCPQDARLHDPLHTMVPTQEIYDRLEECPARFKMLLVDACRDRHFVPDDTPLAGRTAVDEAKSMAEFTKSLLDPSRLPKATLAMISCSSDEQSYEDPKLGHGIFMYYVLEGLAGKADRTYLGDRDNFVSYRELKDYVYRKTSDHAFDKHERAQTPNFYAKWELSDFNLVEVLGPCVYTDWPFDADEAKRRQQETAEVLGQPVELTNSIGMKLKLVPAGEFVMGSAKSPQEIVRMFDLDEGDAKQLSDEQSQDEVRITKPFYLGVHEVTLGQFLKFYHAAKYKTEAERDGKGGRGWRGGRLEQRKAFVPWSWGFSDQTMDHPVVNVTWNDAVAFCEWLSRKEDETYRLPSHAEWEYACRAGTATTYYHGDDPEGLARVGNVADATAKARFIDWPTISARDGYVFTAPVGSFRSNAFGLSDMHGNVFEWCHGRRSLWFSLRTRSPQRFPVRGGSWIVDAWHCRSASRYVESHDFRHCHLGFRVARSPSVR